jgi:GYD domain
MPTFVMLTRLNADIERNAMKRVREECPDVEWLNSYAVLGPCDYLDSLIASDIETAAKVSALIRTFGHAQTEIWTATEWDHFQDQGKRAACCRHCAKGSGLNLVQSPSIFKNRV